MEGIVKQILEKELAVIDAQIAELQAKRDEITGVLGERKFIPSANAVDVSAILPNVEPEMMSYFASHAGPLFMPELRDHLMQKFSAPDEAKRAITLKVQQILNKLVDKKILTEGVDETRATRNTKGTPKGKYFYTLNPKARKPGAQKRKRA